MTISSIKSNLNMHVARKMVHSKEWKINVFLPIQERGRGRRFFAYRGYKFDSIGESQSLSAEEIEELDRVSMVSLKTLKIPDIVRNKLHNLAKQFIKKKDLEKLGRFMAKKLTSRNCVELPRVLPSKLLCELKEEKNKIEKMLDKKSYKCLKQFLLNYENKSKEVEQVALTYAEDTRHKVSISFFPEVSIAYTLHNFNGNYGIIYRILHEIKVRIGDFTPSVLLSYSSVPAAGVIAAQEIFTYKFDKIVTVEPSEHLTSISKYLMDHISNVQYQMHLYEQGHTFDLIILSHTLLSLYDYNSRNLFVKNVWNKLSKKGIIVIIENGTPTGFRMLHSIREMFITELKFDKFHIVAPCPHESICPLSLTGKDWCHFSQRTLRLSHHIYCKGSRAKNVEEEKYSYLVIRKCEGPRTKYKSESEAVTVKEKSFFWPRVVMPTIKAGKHVLIDVCSYPYNFERLVVTKSSSLLSNIRTKSGSILKGYGYKKARKILWGDLWRFTKRISRPDARLYTPEVTKRHLYRLYQKQKRRENVKSIVDKKSEQFYSSRAIHSIVAEYYFLGLPCSPPFPIPFCESFDLCHYSRSRRKLVNM
ncbi:mitochondrial ribosomal protein S22 precursor, putative [Plasmodium ovale curtisi]|uniref:Mitochondrial ribosomal protein S22, putative n=1 Tax=Plasmodium ovale curtisi TaxID=864141 RepID=A0A1A8VPH5_PLAOA|nr:mitochondrial ribosomal protein S22 precursor, putative [Plasmodium ovale curtisi]SBT00652.1 mitochondrial ribosomal protein S22 precursor, putative [Plasmodium ovale curtisi]